MNKKIIFFIFLLSFLLAGCSKYQQVVEQQENTPEWVEWLAQHWDEDSSEWMSEATEDNIDIELWLRENTTYGENNKCWTIIDAVEDCNGISVVCRQALTEDDWESIGKALVDQIIVRLSSENEAYSFCFRNIEDINVNVEWNESTQGWICLAKGSVNFDGIILPYGTTVEGEYLDLALGTYQITHEGDQYGLSLLPSEAIA